MMVAIPLRPAEARVLLGVGPGATHDEVRAAFRRRVAAAHPDTGGRAEELQRLIEARDTLLRAATAAATRPPVVVVSTTPWWRRRLPERMRRRSRPRGRTLS